MQHLAQSHKGTLPDLLHIDTADWPGRRCRHNVHTSHHWEQMSQHVDVVGQVGLDVYVLLLSERIRLHHPSEIALEDRGRSNAVEGSSQFWLVERGLIVVA